MGWWHVNFDLTNPDAIGDSPADILDEALSRIAQSSQEKPSLQEIIDTLALLLRKYPAAYYREGREQRVSALTAELREVGKAPPSQGSLVGSGSSHDGIASLLAGALLDVVSVYQEEIQRMPRCSELLALFSFVLGSEYCSDMTPDMTATLVAQMAWRPFGHVFWSLRRLIGLQGKAR